MQGGVRRSASAGSGEEVDSVLGPVAASSAPPSYELHVEQVGLYLRHCLVCHQVSDMAGFSVCMIITSVFQAAVGAFCIQSGQRFLQEIMRQVTQLAG